MKRALSAASLAAVALFYACSDSTSPITQEQADESLATTIAAADVDPNSETTTGGHLPNDPKSTATQTCSYDATTKWTTCTWTQDGLSVSRQVQFLTTGGVAQQHPDSTTLTMKSKTTVTGTIVRHTTSVTDSTTVNRSSDETVTGVQKSSTQRVVSGTATGTENSKVIDSRGTMTIQRTYADTTNALTFNSPPNPQAPWPVSGTVIRNMSSTGRLNDGASKGYASRTVQTFNANGTMTFTTTVNGVTRTCTVQLSSNQKPSCSP